MKTEEIEKLIDKAMKNLPENYKKTQTGLASFLNNKFKNHGWRQPKVGKLSI